MFVRIWIRSFGQYLSGGNGRVGVAHAVDWTILVVVIGKFERRSPRTTVVIRRVENARPPSNDFRIPSAHLVMPSFDWNHRTYGKSTPPKSTIPSGRFSSGFQWPCIWNSSQNPSVKFIEPTSGIGSPGSWPHAVRGMDRWKHQRKEYIWTASKNKGMEIVQAGMDNYWQYQASKKIITE
jgi:hypothetical protein